MPTTRFRTAASPSGDPLREALASCDRRMTEAQALALALRIGPRTRSFCVTIAPFDLPDGYLLVTFDDGFTCGISPAGDVSS